MQPTYPVVAQPLLDRFVGLMQVANALYRGNSANSVKTMDISQSDVQSFFRSLNRFGVQYLLVGDLADVVHGYVHTTEVLEIWVKYTRANELNLIDALTECGVDAKNSELMVVASLAIGGITIHSIQGVPIALRPQLKAFTYTDFDACYARARDATFDDVPFKVIHLNDLITEKKATGRPKDLGDVDELSKIV